MDSLPDGPDRVRLDPPDAQTVLEGDPITPVQCTADCNPQCTYTWTGPGHTAASNQLVVQAIHRSQAGQHNCEASNSVGSQIGSLTITVHYPPDMTVSVRPASMVEEERVTVVCTADSNPNPTLSWSNVTRNSERLDGDISSSEAEITLTIQNARCQKQSQIQCSADNGVEGSPGTKVAELDVKCKYFYKHRVMALCQYTDVPIFEKMLFEPILTNGYLSRALFVR